MRSPVKYSKWYQPDEPDRELPNPSWFAIGYSVGILAVVLGLLALIV